jgi:hypothetical protein
MIGDYSRLLENQSLVAFFHFWKWNWTFACMMHNAIMYVTEEKNVASEIFAVHQSNWAHKMKCNFSFSGLGNAIFWPWRGGKYLNGIVEKKLEERTTSEQ